MKSLLLWLCLAYFGYAAVMIAVHPRLIYPFSADDRVLDGFSRVQLTGADGTPIFVQERPGNGPVILYFMGNAGAVPLFESAFERHILADRHVIVLEYRGGGGRPGTPSESVLKSDAEIAFEYAAERGKPVIVQGFSLGTGLATHVAAQGGVAGVVLTAPYDALCGLMSTRAYLPACLMPFVQKWKSLDRARAIAVPMLVLHGAEDALIPPRYSAGYSTLANVDRVLIARAGHNDIGLFPEFDRAIEAFIARLNQDP